MTAEGMKRLMTIFCEEGIEGIIAIGGGYV